MPSAVYGVQRIPGGLAEGQTDPLVRAAGPRLGLLPEWRTWVGDYGSKKQHNPGEHTLFAFLTTDANDVVRPVHAKAMTVILRSEEEQAEGLSAPVASSALEIVSDEEAGQYVGFYLK